MIVPVPAAASVPHSARHRLGSLVVVAALALAACGEDDQRTDVEGPAVEEMGDPAAYFGVTPCTCYEFVEDREGGGLLKLGVAVESITELHSPGRPQYLMRYRLGGQVKRVDHLVPSEPDLLLSGVSIGREWDDFWQLSEPIPFVRFPMQEQSQAITATRTAQHQLAGSIDGEPVEVSWRADYSASQIYAATDGEAPTQVDVTRISHIGLPWAEGFRYYVPRQGLVKFDLDFGEGRTVWRLHRIRQLGGGCPWDPSTRIDHDQICGTTQQNP